MNSALKIRGKYVEDVLQVWDINKSKEIHVDSSVPMMVKLIL
jgi:hypothetical protein